MKERSLLCISVASYKHSKCVKKCGYKCVWLTITSSIKTQTGNSKNIDGTLFSVVNVFDHSIFDVCDGMWLKVI